MQEHSWCPNMIYGLPLNSGTEGNRMKEKQKKERPDLTLVLFGGCPRRCCVAELQPPVTPNVLRAATVAPGPFPQRHVIVLGPSWCPCFSYRSKMSGFVLLFRSRHPETWVSPEGYAYASVDMRSAFRAIHPTPPPRLPSHSRQPPFNRHQLPTNSRRLPTNSRRLPAQPEIY